MASVADEITKVLVALAPLISAVGSIWIALAKVRRPVVSGSKFKRKGRPNSNIAALPTPVQSQKKSWETWFDAIFAMSSMFILLIYALFVKEPLTTQSAAIMFICAICVLIAFMSNGK